MHTWSIPSSSKLMSENFNRTHYWYLVCSIWTVDLAYILQKFSISFSYYTVTFGVNPNYSVETFYKVIHCRPYNFYRNGLEKYRDSKLLVSRQKVQRVVIFYLFCCCHFNIEAELFPFCKSCCFILFLLESWVLIVNLLVSFSFLVLKCAFWICAGTITKWSGTSGYVI